MPAAWVAAATVAVGVYSADQAKKTAEENRAASAAGQAKNQEFSEQRFAEAKGYMNPYIEDARTARNQLMVEMGLAPGEANTAYMESPGYLAAMEGAEQRMASGGMAYSGARAGATQRTSAQFYNNYMGMLQNIGNPDAATNLSSLGMDQAATLGSQNQAYINSQNQARLQGTEAQNAALADMMSGISNIYAGSQAGGNTTTMTSAGTTQTSSVGAGATPPGGVSQQGAGMHSQYNPYAGTTAYGEEEYI